MFFLNTLTGVKACAKLKKEGFVPNEQLFHSLTLDSHPSIARREDKIYCRNTRRAASAIRSLLLLLHSGHSTGSLLCSNFIFTSAQGPVTEGKASGRAGVSGGRRSWTSFCPWRRRVLRTIRLCQSVSGTPLLLLPPPPTPKSTCLGGTSLLNGVFTHYRPASVVPTGEQTARLSLASFPSQRWCSRHRFEGCAAKEKKILVCVLRWKTVSEEARWTRCCHFPRGLGVKPQWWKTEACYESLSLKWMTQTLNTPLFQLPSPSAPLALTWL